MKSPIRNKIIFSVIAPVGIAAMLVTGCAGAASAVPTPTNTAAQVSQLEAAAPFAGQIPVGFNPEGIAITPNGQFAYVADHWSGISVISTASHAVVATIPTGSNCPSEVVVSPSGRFAYVTADADVYVIATATNSVVDVIPVGGFLNGIATTPDSSTLHVADYSGRTVTAISTATNKVTATIEGFNGPDGLAVSANGSRLYVVNQASGTVSVVSTTDHRIVGTIKVGSQPNDIVVAPTGSTAYVTDGDHGAVSVIDTATDRVTGTIDIGATTIPEGLAVNSGFIYVACPSTNESLTGTVVTIDRASQKVVQTSQAGNEPLGIALLPQVATNGATAYVTNYDDGGLVSPDTVSVIPINGVAH